MRENLRHFLPKSEKIFGYFLPKSEKAVTKFSKAGGATLPQRPPPVAPPLDRRGKYRKEKCPMNYRRKGKRPKEKYRQDNIEKKIYVKMIFTFNV
jgi:hypothetical protein